MSEDDQPTRQFRFPEEPPPTLRPHGAPWQGPPERRRLADLPVDVWTPKITILILGMILVALLVMCGIAAWFVAEIVPG